MRWILQRVTRFTTLMLITAEHIWPLQHIRLPQHLTSVCANGALTPGLTPTVVLIFAVPNLGLLRAFSVCTQLRNAFDVLVQMSAQHIHDESADQHAKVLATAKAVASGP